MPRRVRVIPYTQASASAATLSSALGARVMRLNGSSFRQRRDDLLINWGNSRYVPLFWDRVLNHPACVRASSNKLTSLTLLDQAGVKTVEFFRDRYTAENYILGGGVIYARKTLTGHSGEGIVVCETVGQLPDAPLYTAGIRGPRREWRLHVVDGEVVLLQKKVRVNGFAIREGTSDDIRNHSNGWVYSVSNHYGFTPEAEDLAIRAVKALGLDFGAVDMITRGDNRWVLEVNTAPGLDGLSTIDAYLQAFNKIKDNMD